MKRNAINVLQKWKNEEHRTPFYLTGIKGVGKTYLAYDFANDFFDSYLYINFDHNKDLVSYFEGLAKEQAISALADYFAIPEGLLYTTPFIFDEIYLCPNFMRNLWDAVSDKDNLYWIFISSYDQMSEDMKQQLFCYTLFPVQFDEFLIAIGKEWYVEVIQAHFQSRRKIPEIVHQELLSIFDEYLLIGGMPDAINEYLTMEASLNVAERHFIQKQMLIYGLSTVPEDGVGYKCQQVFSTISEQLMKPNQKFQFNLIRKGTTYQMYKEALDFLVKHHLVYRMQGIEKEEQQFKLFYPDFSFVSSIRDGELTAVEQQIRLQNYLYQTLVQKEIPCWFWEAKSQASMDFIIKTEDTFIPVELKTEGKSKSKSIHSFAKQYPSQKSLRISSSNFVENDEFLVLPLYSLFCF